MQCSVMLGRDHNSGNIKMKTFSNYKNPYKKEPNLDIIVDQLCTRLQDIKDKESTSQVGMPTCSIEQAEAVRRYYAAFPALKKGQESPLQYYIPPPPPAWCRRAEVDIKVKMQCELTVSKEQNIKNKKLPTGKERRNSYHGQKKNNRKRCNSYSRSFESKESLPEWVTHEGVWDMEAQDPVKEFIRAIALDEGYGTCENTVTDEIKEITEIKIRMNDNTVPDLDDSLDFDAEWVIKEDYTNPKEITPIEEELYARFEAKFDRSIEALWSKDQNTPDDEFQELPIDFQDLLSSPSDHAFADPSVEKCSLISLAESIWSNEAADGLRADRADSPSRIVEVLHDRFKPLNLADAAEPPPPPPPPQSELESFALYEGDEIYDALSTVANTMRSFTALNHSREFSGFAEVPPRRPAAARAPPPRRPAPARAPPPAASPPRDSREDLLTSTRTHFKPIRREADTETAKYADGDTFDIRGDLDQVEFFRSESGGVYSKSSLERYLEYRSSKSIDYGRLNLTESQRCPDLDDPGFRLRFPVRQIDAAVQTDRPPDAWGACEECGRAAKKMRSNAIDADGIWGEACGTCAPALSVTSRLPPPEEMSREWEELLSDISAAHAMYADKEESPGDRKRRHSAALRCAAACPHPHARFLHCCAVDRPLTR
ncbi:unnamed protein product [Diatraea saccharalis]|nr:unnamed protein product [Diatraea saccharalis]